MTFVSLPQGFVKLSVWLYVDLRGMENDCNPDENSPAEQQMQGAETTDGSFAQPISICGGNTVELRNVGEVEISEDAMLEDLKTQVRFCVNLQ